MQWSAIEEGESRGLECEIGGRRLVLPFASVDQLIDYRRECLPLSRPGIAGIGIYGDEILLSLTLSGALLPPQVTTKGVLLRVSVRGVRLALEVDGAFSFVSIETVSRTHPHNEPWLLFGRTAAGSVVCQLDAEAFLAAHGLEIDS